MNESCAKIQRTPPWNGKLYAEVTLVIRVGPPTAVDARSTCREIQADRFESLAHPRSLLSRQEAHPPAADQNFNRVLVEAVTRVWSNCGDALMLHTVASVSTAFGHDR
jgi:hypothetical protein